MNQRKSLQVDLPKEEADSLEARAAMQGVPTGKYLGYHVLRSYRGVLHPEVVDFERGDEGQAGTRPEDLS
ncbi:hypothetical protein [Paraburkholderia sp. 22B1P]|uniref:hypothetical protein n=1 Tax=Paraburkholderia sp. 22B1P TaxID=3080498 RepID=UPI00308B66D3|nr:hypothetical protein PBP221_17350 [Paraburkholderia sp. 22B1P]